MTKVQPPWASGPAEILKHGLQLLQKDNDTNRRLAMISIDNAVELTIKTYLGLPKRVTNLNISRSEYQGFAESFPKLLDALETYASDKLDGIDLGEIEWYHRLRNQLYHQGNGLTVERDKVEIYAELANVLFANLFDYVLITPKSDNTTLLGEFMLAWANFERTVSIIYSTHTKTEKQRFVPLSQMTQYLIKEGIITDAEKREIDGLQKLRNEVVHGHTNYKENLRSEMIEKLTAITNELSRF